MGREAPPHSEAAEARIARFHPDTVAEVGAAIGSHRVVVVGMGWNPHVRRARRALDEGGVPYHYLGYGNYVTGWRQRLAIKLWSGWPTFPQVYCDGRLVGGADEAIAALADGTLKQTSAA
ncbi:MAG: glutaredoxin domain-containing protein [Myxococcota bacterium]